MPDTSHMQQQVRNSVTEVDYPKWNPKPLNDSTHSQGMLFAMPKPPDEHRWPAGYTPERKSAVSAAMADTEVHVAHHDAPRSGDLFLSSKAFFTPSEDDPNRGKWKREGSEIREAQAAHGRAMVTDTLARSTVPIEDMAKLPTIHVERLNSSLGNYSHPESGWSNTRGEMGQSLDDPASRTRGRITMDPRGSMVAGQDRTHQEHTLIHELGHHVDRQNNPEEYQRALAARPQGEAVSPALEGAAEGFAAKHHVPRRTAVDPSYASNASYTHLHGDPDFARRFEAVSGKTSVEAMGRDRESPTHGAQFHQQHLFGRPVDSAETGTEKDYGQWGFTNYSGAKESDLGTVTMGRGAPPQEQRMQPGFRPGDAEIVKGMRSGYKKYDAPESERKRVASTWNAQRPDETVRPN